MLIDEIFNVCCHYFEVTAEQMKGRGRNAALVRPRHITIFVLHRSGQFCQSSIAQLFDRDPSCVSNVISKVQWQLNKPDQHPHLVSEVKHLLKEVKRLDNESTSLEMPGYQGLTCLPTYHLSLSEDESGWLYWMWMQRGDIQKFNGGWILNAKMYHEAWKRGNFSIGSERIRAILDRAQSSHTYILIVPHSSEVKCPIRTTSPASSLGETIPAKSGS